LTKFLKVYGYLLTIAAVIIILDQWTKAIIRSRLSFTETWSPAPWLEPYFQIVHWKNTGAAFGILQDFGGVFTILAIVVSFIIIYYIPRIPYEDWPLRLAMGLQLGGAVGNLIDRLTIGYVVDFIAILPSWNMPVFNIADASITGGVVALIIGVWVKERREKKQAAQQSERHDHDCLNSKLPEDPCSE
jgi:signal peptidase II